MTADDAADSGQASASVGRVTIEATLATADSILACVTDVAVLITFGAYDCLGLGLEQPLGFDGWTAIGAALTIHRDDVVLHFGEHGKLTCRLD